MEKRKPATVERDARIKRMYDNGKGPTMRQIASIENITHQAVQQSLLRSKAKMRKRKDWSNAVAK